jgi:hypothetical protein
VLKKRMDLETSVADGLDALSTRDLSARLPQLANEMGGRLDMLVMVEAESEFASRMGTHRVWFEARGKVVALDVWTGKVLAEMEGLVTESGVGESRAELSAQEMLGKDLAAKLKDALQNARK